MNLTERELAELVRRAEAEKNPRMPSTRRAKKDARHKFKKMRMAIRREEKRTSGLTRRQVDQLGPGARTQA